MSEELTKAVGELRAQFAAHRETFIRHAAKEEQFMETIRESIAKQTGALDRMTASNMELNAVQRARLEYEREQAAKDEAKERRQQEIAERRSNWFMEQLGRHGALIVAVGVLVTVQACAPQAMPIVVRWLTGGVAGG